MGTLVAPYESFCEKYARLMQIRYTCSEIDFAQTSCA